VLDSRKYCLLGAKSLEILLYLSWSLAPWKVERYLQALSSMKGRAVSPSS
jgi:hypothetical protein